MMLPRCNIKWSKKWQTVVDEALFAECETQFTRLVSEEVGEIISKGVPSETIVNLQDQHLKLNVHEEYLKYFVIAAHKGLEQCNRFWMLSFLIITDLNIQKKESTQIPHGSCTSCSAQVGFSESGRMILQRHCPNNYHDGSYFGRTFYPLISFENLYWHIIHRLLWIICALEDFL